jgi:SLIT-ROBO Rho GTPase activating protein
VDSVLNSRVFFFFCSVLFSQCREISFESHEELLKVLHELHTTMKTYHTYWGEFRTAESKLLLAEKQKRKLEETIPLEKLVKRKKFRLIEKDIEKARFEYRISIIPPF